jgi:protein-S-isoprenylcysteine O-methyltransferase Ste14
MYILIFVLCTLGLCIRTLYEMLKSQGKVKPGNNVLFWAVFAGMFLMLASWVVLGRFDPVRLALPATVRWIGLAAVLLGAALAAGGLLQLRGLENIDHLVTGGLFRKIRHPMYTGFILWIVGWVVFYGAVASCGLAAICIINILMWRKLEEWYLGMKYGEEFSAYRQTTWF